MGAHKFKIGQFENYNPRSKLGSGVCQIAQLVPPAGRQLGIAGANGAIPTWRCFYQIEGKAVELDAMRFDQSLDLT